MRASNKTPVLVPTTYIHTYIQTNKQTSSSKPNNEIPQPDRPENPDAVRRHNIHLRFKEKNTPLESLLPSVALYNPIDESIDWTAKCIRLDALSRDFKPRWVGGEGSLSRPLSRSQAQRRNHTQTRNQTCNPKTPFQYPYSGVTVTHTHTSDEKAPFARLSMRSHVECRQ